MSKRKKKLIIISILFVIYTALSWWGFMMERVDYTINSDKISDEIKIVFISDLHNCFYGGTDNSKLLNEIEKAEPDIVLFGGDVIDFKGGTDYSLELMEKINNKYPCAYTPGNHETMRDDEEEFYQNVEELGIPILLGDKIDFTADNQTISVYGVIDSWDYGKTKPQIEECRDMLNSDNFSILLAHQPEQYLNYLNAENDEQAQNTKDSFDLILSGHAHGGQWSLPKILEQGLYAPDQGLFPNRTKGLFTSGDTTQIVSRGLARPLRMIFIPRIFNRPELTVITVN